MDLKEAGLYKYAQSQDFEILLFAWMEDGGNVQIADLKCEEVIPTHIIEALNDASVIKHAYNAAFEDYCLRRAGYKTDISQWQCTMVHGLYCGYTMGLEATGAAIGLPQDKQKMKIGKALIRYFSVPCKPTKANGGRMWNDPKHDPEKWELYKEYCMQDVVTEHEIELRLRGFPMPEHEWELWRWDNRMNERGVRIDSVLVDGALSVDSESKERLLDEAEDITGLSNPNSPSQLKAWIEKESGMEMPDMTKETVKEWAEYEGLPDHVRRVLKLRLMLGMTSIKKYASMKKAAGEGDRLRGLYCFYGAHTGRWTARIVQPQNLSKNLTKLLDEARSLVKSANYEGLEMLFGNVPDILSQLVRTAFIPSEGNKFVVADFSAIEARVLGWLAGEKHVMDTFATHGKIYEATAAKMYGVPFDTIVKGHPNYEYRKIGKVSTLALGYQGGTGSMVALGALNAGLKEEDLPGIVRLWRSSNPRIVELWYKLEQAVTDVMSGSGTVYLPYLTVRRESDLLYGMDFLTIELPTGRKLFYPKPKLLENKFGRMALHYSTVNQQSRKWSVESTYGGKLTENIVQAIARDCLVESMKKIEQRGWDIVLHIHDEVVLDVPQEVQLQEVCGIMGEPISWAPGLILKAEGFEGKYYKKD